MANEEKEEKKKKEKKPKTPKAKNGKTVIGGEGKYKEETFEDIVKKDIEYVDGLVNSKDPISAEEDDFVDWLLNKEDGRALYSKFRGKAQGKCMPSCTVM